MSGNTTATGNTTVKREGAGGRQPRDCAISDTRECSGNVPRSRLALCLWRTASARLRGGGRKVGNASGVATICQTVSESASREEGSLHVMLFAFGWLPSNVDSACARLADPPMPTQPAHGQRPQSPRSFYSRRCAAQNCGAGLLAQMKYERHRMWSPSSYRRVGLAACCGRLRESAFRCRALPVMDDPIKTTKSKRSSGEKDN